MRRALGLTLLVAAMVVSACGADEPQADSTTTTQVIGTSTIAEDATLWDAIRADRTLSTYAAIVVRSGYDEELSSTDADYTVLAPTNAALDRLGVDIVEPAINRRRAARDLVEWTLLAGRFRSGDLRDGQELLTIAQGPQRVSRGDRTTSIGGAPVVQADVETASGVLHVVNGVPFPVGRS